MIMDVLIVNVVSILEDKENVFLCKLDVLNIQEVSVLDVLKTSDLKEDNAEYKDVHHKESTLSLDHSANTVCQDLLKLVNFVKFKTALNY